MINSFKRESQIMAVKASFYILLSVFHRLHQIIQNFENSLSLLIDFFLQIILNRFEMIISFYFCVFFCLISGLQTRGFFINLKIETAHNR